MRLFFVIPALFALSSAGCGASTKGAIDPALAAGQGQYGGQIGSAAGQYNPGVGQPGPGQYNPGQPQPQQPVPAQPQPQPQQPAQGAAGGSASPINAAMLTPALTLLAQGEVQGSQPEGGAFAGQFQEGQTLEQPLTLNPGKCYTVIGASAGIQQLDASIVLHQPPFPPAVVSQSNTQGPQAVLGGKGACWKNLSPIPLPAKVILKATRGAGMAAGQVYSK